MSAESQPVPIVIPLHEDGGKYRCDMELRFTLRSLEKYFTDPFEVVIVGRRVPGVVTNVRHLVSKRGLKTALRHAAEAYPDGFFWMYDDCHLLRPTSAAEMRRTPCLSRRMKAVSAWAQSLDRVFRRLEKEGYPARDFSRPHGPYWFDKGMVDEAFRDWPGMKAKFPFETWILNKRDAERVHGAHRQYYGEFRNPPGPGKRYVNYNDAGNTPELRAWLRATFPEGSRFEVTAGMGEPWEPRAHVIDLESRPRWGADCVRGLAKAGIQARIFPGVDGRDGAAVEAAALTVNEQAFEKMYRRRPLPGEIGCYASHVTFARAVVAGDVAPVSPLHPDWFLVCEDDAEPYGFDAEELRHVLRMARGYDYILLHPALRGAKHAGEREVRRVVGREIGTQAYLISRKACEVVAAFEMRHPIDHALTRCKRLTGGSLWGEAHFEQRREDGTDGIYREREAQKRARTKKHAVVVADCTAGARRGLGNRLTTICAAYACAKRRGLPLAVKWRPGEGCGVEWRELFEPPEGVSFLEDEPEDALVHREAYYTAKNRKRHADLAGIAELDARYWADWREAAALIRPRAGIGLPDRRGFTAVHLRSNHDRRRLEDRWWEAWPDPGEVFVATDHPGVLEKALEVWPRAWALPAARAPEDMDGRDAAGQIEAVRDMFMLCRAGLILGNRVETTFRNLAHLGHGVPVAHLYQGDAP